MNRLRPAPQGWQAALLLLSALLVLAGRPVFAEEAKPAQSDVIVVPLDKLGTPDDPTMVTSAADMRPYRVTIPGTEVSFEMVPIKGGEFLLGSPADEEGRDEAEGPRVRVRVEPFWMGKCEVTWDEYDVWNFDLDIQRRAILMVEPQERDEVSDAVTRPTPPYTDMTFDSGHDKFPAISMTQLAAKVYCQWLGAKTGHYYRLPTEAEWEHAARAGTDTPYFFGDDSSRLEEYAWYTENAGDEREANYHKVGSKKPNPWGLHDVYGNVSEWCLDQYDPKWYAHLTEVANRNGGVVVNPLNVATKEYPHVVRGGSWDEDVEGCRSAWRGYSEDWWKIQDPQLPKSVWYHTDAQFVGFRLLRPLRVPGEEERTKLELDPVVPKHARTKKAGR